MLKNGVEGKGTLLLVTNRTLTESELKEANNGVDIPEPTAVEEGDVRGDEEEEEKEEEEEVNAQTRLSRTTTRASRRT